MADSTKTFRYGRDQVTQHEDSAGAAVDVGQLLEKGANGPIPHGTDGAVLDQVLVAKDARGRGMELGDSYASGSNMHYFNANSGAGLHLRLDAGESVTGPADGSPTRLVSSGNGNVRAFNADADDDVVALADETLDNSGGASAVDVAAEVIR